jgi:hypothetical protein
MNEGIAAALRAPFNRDQIGHLPKVTCRDCSDRDKNCQKHQRTVCPLCKAYVSTAHIHIDYVGHAHVTERLLEVDPGWTWEPVAFTGNGLPAIDDNGGLWIRLTVGGKPMLGYGNADGKRGGDATKIAIGDAIRNAGIRFGIALDLWKKEAPAPVSDRPERQVERPPQTHADRAAELRGQIAAIGRAAGKQVAEIGDDFAAWSQGQDISKATVAVLAEYKEHLQRGAA